jgi:glycosyltransferase involved in cell wall biosynthesis
MKVSVVIPVFNEEALIVRCLTALQNQTKKAFEIIVVDNNSTDKTVEAAKQFPVKIVTEKKQGAIYARNTGFNSAQGDIIGRIDADTLVPANWIEEIQKHFTDDSNLIALSGPTFFDDKKFNNLLFVEKIFLPTWKLIFGHDVLYGPNTVITKEAWEKVKDTVCLDDKKVHEDFDLAIHLGKLKMGKILFDKKFVVQVSERCWRNPKSYWEYPLRYLKTILRHKKLF